MRPSLLRAIFRGIAIVIAVAAIADPAWSIERASAIPLTLIKMTTEDVSAIERDLRRLSSVADVQLRDIVHHRVPCGPGDRCVVIADGSVDAGMPEDLDRPLSLIRVVDTAGPNVRLRSVIFASGQQPSAAGVARVVIDSRGASGHRSEIRIVDGAAIVGSAVVEWKSDRLQTIDVPWWPLASGPRALRVEAMPTANESVLFDNVLTAGVDVGAERVPVLVFDARSSWGSTFVRRALEDDARFLVEHRVRLAPAIAAGTANARLDARALDTPSVLIVGGPDALTANDVDLIERFVRMRGGTVVLLPERAPSGSVTRLFAGEWSERLTSEPQSVGPLRATELLVASAAGATGATSATGAVVVAPTGAGRLVIPTAMDAWRYRDADGGAFDRFWRSVVAEGAAAGARLQLQFENAVATPGARQEMTVRHRSMTPSSTLQASAVARCGPTHRAQTIRLWPAGSPSALRGELPIADTGACTVEVTVNDARATRGVAVSAALSRPADDTLAQLERYARASGGVVTDKDNLAAIVQSPPRAPVTTPMRPMHSGWWLVPFAGCLSIEWWLRRRTGLR